MREHPTEHDVFWWKDPDCGCDKACNCGNWIKHGLPYNLKRKEVNEKFDHTNLLWVNGDGSIGS